jgi:hypothetical protein
MFSRFLGRKDERTSPVGSGAAPPLVPPTPIKDSLEYIKTDVGSRKSLVDIATQILETSDEPTAAASASASTPDDDKIRAFLNKVKSNPEYIQLLKDITKSTIETITTQSQNKEISYTQSIIRANTSSNKEPARRYMIQAYTYFKSIGDEARARMFEGPLSVFIDRTRRKPIARRSRKTRRVRRRTNKRPSRKTRKL